MTVYLLTYFDRSKMQSIGANGISFCGAYCSEVICERSGGKAGLAGLILVNLWTHQAKPDSCYVRSGSFEVCLNKLLRCERPHTKWTILPPCSHSAHLPSRFTGGPNLSHSVVLQICDPGWSRLMLRDYCTFTDCPLANAYFLATRKDVAVIRYWFRLILIAILIQFLQDDINLMSFKRVWDSADRFICTLRLWYCQTAACVQGRPRQPLLRWTCGSTALTNWNSGWFSSDAILINQTAIDSNIKKASSECS